MCHSSVRAHLSARDDGLAAERPLLDRAPNFADLLDTDPDDPGFGGRPLGMRQLVNTVASL